ncbi:aldo/keto reductase [Halomarina salina]|uniref:Aldo/keto reductase n=1 Tax=Halomarina salina TaxID=1872699 RepID=A0ABD5RH52_9EURY|nr:aldo/keto reductase [Halomarina salina]
MDQLPRPGLGTSGYEDDEECAENVRTALDVGYRHVDTAQMYDTERAVGEAVADSDVDSEEVFVATKVAPENLAHDDVLETARESADRLGVDSIDLLYVHWPNGAYDAEGTLSAFDELVDEGLVEHVGLSNFTVDLLDEARDVLDAPVFAHQVECHPLLPQDELREYAREDDHSLVAYGPFGRGSIMDDDTIQSVAEDHDLTAHQVALAWSLSKENVVPIPKATGEDHLRANYEARDLDLPQEALDRLDDIDERTRRFDPDDAPWN